MKEQFCEQCGAKLSADAKFCKECGAKVAPATETPQPPVNPTPVESNVAAPTVESAQTAVTPDEPQADTKRETVSPTPDTEGAIFCNHCGTKLPSGATFCDNCGAKLENGTNETINHKNVATPATPTNDKKKKLRPWMIVVGVIVVIVIGLWSNGTFAKSAAKNVISHSNITKYSSYDIDTKHKKITFKVNKKGDKELQKEIMASLSSSNTNRKIAFETELQKIAEQTAKSPFIGSDWQIVLKDDGDKVFSFKGKQETYRLQDSKEYKDVVAAYDELNDLRDYLSNHDSSDDSDDKDIDRTTDNTNDFEDF